MTPYLKTSAGKVIDRIASAAKITPRFSFSGRMSLAPRISVIADDWCNPSLQSCLRAPTATDTPMIPPWRFSVSRKMAGCAPIFFSVAGRCGFSRVHALYEMRPIYFFERSRTRPFFGLLGRIWHNNPNRRHVSAPIIMGMSMAR